MPIEKELAKLSPAKETLITIGVFDGVHVGHQYLLSCLHKKAREHGWLSTVITFKTHPEAVVATGSQQPWLTDLNTRLGLIKSLGIDIIIALSFTREISKLDAGQFAGLLKKHIKMAGMIIGPDFAMGIKRQGNAERLRDIGKTLHFTVDVMPPFMLDGEIVSSSVIRRILADGDVRKAAKFLGRPFRFSSRIIEGDKMGRIFGFPTANMEPNIEFAMPGNGVYATITNIDSKSLPSVTNIGTRPTFGGMKQLIETHIFNYQGNLYDRIIAVDFIDRIREEKRFGNVEALKIQIAHDVEVARAILANRVFQVEPIV